MVNNMLHGYRDDIRLHASCLAISALLAIVSVFVYKPSGSWIERIFDYREVVGSVWRVVLLVVLIVAGVVCCYVGLKAYSWLGKLLAFGGLVAVVIALWRILMPFVVATLIIGGAFILADGDEGSHSSYNRRRRY